MCKTLSFFIIFFTLSFSCTSIQAKNLWLRLEGLPEFNSQQHSDGCSGGMSSIYAKLTFLHDKHGEKLKWHQCCVIHDKAYYYGGSQSEKKYADKNLKECVGKATGNKFLAKSMQIAVRIGGSPHLPTPYRWGYGEDFRK